MGVGGSGGYCIEVEGGLNRGDVAEEVLLARIEDGAEVGSGFGVFFMGDALVSKIDSFQPGGQADRSGVGGLGGRVLTLPRGLLLASGGGAEAVGICVCNALLLYIA